MARASTAAAVLAAVPGVAAAQTAAPIPVIVVNGRGHGHGVGMAQDGALAMGLAGATTAQILNQFYPGTSIGKASGNVRVPVFTGNNVELTFPDGGEIRGYPAAGNPPGATLPMKFAPGARARLYRDGESTRVQPIAAPPAPSTTTSSSTSPSSSSTTSTTVKAITTTTNKFQLPRRNGTNTPAPVTISTTSTTVPAATTTTTAPPQAALVSGTVTATGAGDGRVGLAPRDRRYRGVLEVTPMGNALRFVNQVNVETYLKGMGEVRNPKWPLASLQAQAIAARTYAMRAMRAGGELCDTQRCQVYIGSDAEYAEMNKAVNATNGQVLVFNKALASAVYSANGGGHSATRFEGFGVSTASVPYLRAAKYPTDDPDNWSVTISLADVARHLRYPGTVSGVEVIERGPSGRATKVMLHGTKGDTTVSGLQFDSSLGLRSTLFELRVTTATKVASIKGGSVLQAPPEEAPTLTKTQTVGAIQDVAPPAAAPLEPIDPKPGTRTSGIIASVLLAGVVIATVRSRRRTTRDTIHAELS